MHPASVLRRLEAYTIPEPMTGCWLCWCGNSKLGYSRLANGRGVHLRGHRVAWEVANGRKLSPKEEVCHRCDTPACVNPDHLFVGTHKDNMADRDRKGRGNQPRELGNGKCRLSDAQVLAICADTRPAKIIAAEYGIGAMYVHKLRVGDARRLLPRNPVYRPRKLSDDQVAEIRNSKTPAIHLAARYGVDRETISRARNGKTPYNFMVAEAGPDMRCKGAPRTALNGVR